MDTVKPSDLIQSCIDHIKSAIDVDPWAAELAEKALRAYREPRLMTLEDVKRLLPGADVWIEYHDLTGWKIAAITVRETFDNGLLGELQSLRYSFDRYGRYNGDWLAWRCWTQRPTDEQREAVPWNA